MNNNNRLETETSVENLSPFRSRHTASFPKLLGSLGASILVTTYQAGMMMILRNDGGILNTHFRRFPKPMGLAHQQGRLAVGCRRDIVEFHNVPAVCQELDKRRSDTTSSLSSPQHDACFLPRRTFTTGDIQIHEIAWCGNQLVFVNTAFSCLASLCEEGSFNPIWRPSFVSELAPGDRCHLNGLATYENRPKYVTALGTTNTSGGWREKKRNGGVVIDVDSQQIVAKNLCMPHSPRCDQGNLWLLQSGDGTLGKINLHTGHFDPLVALPGFTRGMSIVQNVAFVGLSKVRKSVIFDDLPLLDRINKADLRSCGVWAIDLRSGKILGYCQFEGFVEELFAVEVLSGVTYPDLVNEDEELISKSFVLGTQALQQVPESFQQENQKVYSSRKN